VHRHSPRVTRVRNERLRELASLDIYNGNGRCLGPNVAEGNGSRARLKRRGKREWSRIVGVCRFLFSVRARDSSGAKLPPLLSGIEEHHRRKKDGAPRWRGGGERGERATGGAAARALAPMVSRWYPSVGRCLFAPTRVSQHTHYRPQRGANWRYILA